MTDVCKLLRLKQSFSCHGGVADSVIAEAERSLGLCFASDYRAYLKEMGSARYFGHELTGLNCPQYIDVVETTLAGRGNYPNVPADCYVIEEAQIDGITYWQDASGAVYVVTPNGQPKEQFASLANYVDGDAESL